MAEDADDPRVGTVLHDRYKIEEALSSGAMGAVYRAERIGLGRVVAIKFLHPHFAQQPDFIKRFEHEALTMSKLNHPNCISVIDFGVVDESPYIVMDYVTGTTLGDILDEGPLAPPRAIDITRQVLAGLAHAHDQGIIHRDIKPANVMLSAATGAGEHVHILDFGLAKLRDADLSMSGIVVGTPSYMSPEQASYKKLDGRSDIYSTGVLLFELLTGDKPFRADEAFDIIRKHLEEPPPALRDRYPEGALSDELEAVVRKALAKSPNDRYSSALEFADALSAAAEGKPGIETRAGTIDAPPARHGSDTPAASAGLAPTLVASATDLDAAPKDDRPGGPASRGSLRPLVVVLAAAGLVGWVAAGAPGVPATWIDGARELVAAVRGAADDRTASGEAVAIESLDDARAVAAQGDVSGALRGLHELRRQRPDDGAILHLIGDLYVERGWYKEALTAYAEAVTLEPELRGREDIAQVAIEALSREGTRQSARVFLIRHIGEPAVGQLRKAASEAESPDVADRLRDVAREIERRADAD